MRRNPRTRVWLVLLAVALVAAACSGDDGGDDAGGNGGSDAGAPGTLIADGVDDLDVDDEMLAAVSEWLIDDSGLSDMLLEELFLVEVTRTGDVTHLTYDQQHGGVAVRGAQFIIHVDGDDAVLGATDSLSETLPGDGTTEELSPDDALEIATRTVDGTVVGDPDVVPTWLEDGDELRLGWEVRLSTRSPVDSLVVVVDATDGDVLTVASVLTEITAPTQSVDACNLPAAPSACVFAIHPSADGDIAADLDDELAGVSLEELDDPDAGELVGRFIEIAPDVADDYAQSDEQWAEDGVESADESFEAANVYYWVTETGLALERLGFDYHADEPVDFVPVDQTGEAFDNAFYDPQRDEMVFGEGSGGINLAQDSSVAMHEYGHAILHSQLPFIISAEGNALHEGFADVVALMMTTSLVEDIGCLGPWAAVNFELDCIRRLDNDRVYPDDLTGEPHDDGEIYGGAVFDLLRAVLADAGIDLADCTETDVACAGLVDEVFETVLASLQFLTSDPGLIEAAGALADADEFVYGGRHAEAIATALAARGLAGPSGSDPTSMTDGDALTLRVDHSYRGDLAADIQVLDGDGTELCGFALFAADSSDNGDRIVRSVPLGDTECAEFLPPSPRRQWRLHIVDTLPEDIGKISEFTVVADGVSYRSRGLPKQIPDDDPVGVVATIDGGGAEDAPTTGDDTAYLATIDVDHTYHGDLSIVVGIYDSTDDSVPCAVDVLDAEPDNSAGGPLSVTADLGACAAAADAGGAGVAWVIIVTDSVAVDTGSLTGVEIVTPSRTYTAPDVPVAIPDDDPDGAAITIAL